MNPMIQTLDSLEVIPHGKGDAIDADTTSEGVVTRVGERVFLACADEIPLFLAVRGKALIGIVASLEDILNESVLASIKKAISSLALNGQDFEAILGPSLTFSHVPVSKELLQATFDRGYRLGTKGTSGQTFLDPQMILFEQLRGLGIDPEHILISDYDTFENPSLLYSLARGDSQKNVFEGILR